MAKLRAATAFESKRPGIFSHSEFLDKLSRKGGVVGQDGSPRRSQGIIIATEVVEVVDWHGAWNANAIVARVLEDLGNPQVALNSAQFESDNDPNGLGPTQECLGGAAVLRRRSHCILVMVPGVVRAYC
jgi:hypothetical protein